MQSKVYAVMEYHDQPLQFINRYYFQIKIEEDDTIYNIMSMMAALPFAIFFTFFLVAIRFILPMIAALLMKLSKAKLKEVKSKMEHFMQPQCKNHKLKTLLETDQQTLYLIKVSIKSDDAKRIADMKKSNTEYVQQILKENNSKYNFYIIDLPGIIHSKWKVSELSICILSIIINAALFAFHIVSGVKLIKYGSTILKDSSVPIVHLILSLLIIIFVYLFTITSCIYKCYKHRKFNIRLLAATSITVNISHLVIYYMPYMLLAFIYNPLQTCTIYSVLVIYVLCGYLVVWGCLQMHSIVREGETDASDETDASNETDNANNLCGSINKKFTVFAINFFTIGLSMVVIYFSFIIVYALTLGSFNDFGVIQNLLPPLLIGLLTFLVIKPTYIKAKQRFNLDSDGQIVKLLLEENCKEAIQQEISPRETNDDDNHHTITSNTS